MMVKIAWDAQSRSLFLESTLYDASFDAVVTW